MKQVPPPEGRPDAPLKALIFDTWYDSYRGVVMLVRVVEGTLAPKQKIQLWSEQEASSRSRSSASSRRSPRPVQRARRRRGRHPRRQRQGRPRRQGRRHRHRGGPAHRPSPFPGFKEVKPMVFSRRLPDRRRGLRAPARRAREAAAERLRVHLRAGDLARRSASASAAASSACSTWRSSRSGSSASTTSTSSPPRRPSSTGSPTRTARSVEIDNPAQAPAGAEDRAARGAASSPATSTCRTEYVGAVLELCQERRGVQKRHQVPRAPKRVQITYEHAARRGGLRLLRQAEERVARLRLDGLRAHRLRGGRPGEARHPASTASRSTRSASSSTASAPTTAAASSAQKLKEVIPQQMYEVAIQAAIGAKIIARETMKAIRKDVHREVLRRRHQPQAQAPREAEGGQEAHEAGRLAWRSRRRRSSRS